MGDDERIEDLSHRIVTILTASWGLPHTEIAKSIALLVHNREKALNKIIAALVIDRSAERRDSPFGLRTCKIFHEAILGKVSHQVEISHEDSYIRIEARML